MSSPAESAPLGRLDQQGQPLRLVPRQSTTDVPDVSGKLHPDQSQKTDSPAVRYPRIVVRDKRGRALDTFTTLQEAIYRANWTRKKMGEWPQTSLQWRLPKAPVPSRPDFSRARLESAGPLHSDPGRFQPTDIQHQQRESGTTGRPLGLTTAVLAHGPTVEIPVDDVGFVAESLNRLPQLPSFSFLRQPLLAGTSTYLQIVASILMHHKFLTATQHRQSHWDFPGFCSGCKRAGFCYGCNKNPRPHVHEDIPAMTGGGFRFWKQDRPVESHDWKHPSRWGLLRSEEELLDLLERCGGLSAYEQAVLRAKMAISRQAAQKTPDGTEEEGQDTVLKLERIRNLNPYHPYLTIVSTEDTGQGANSQQDTEAHPLWQRGTSRRSGRTSPSSRRKVTLQDRRSRSRSLESRASEESVDRTLVRVNTDYLNKITSKDHDITEQSRLTEHESKLTDDSRAQDIDLENWSEQEAKVKKQRLKDENLVDRQSSSESTFDPDENVTLSGDNTSFLPKLPTNKARHSVIQEKDKHRLEKQQKRSGRDLALRHKDEERDNGRVIIDEDEDMKKREKAKQSVPFGSKRQDIEYTAPKFFQVQKSSRKITTARDPFSRDRQLDLPTGPAFQLKKSQKKTTDFVDFKRGDRNWQPPKKFEVKHGHRSQSRSPTSKKGRKSRKKQVQAVSPDSGLDSDTGGFPVDGDGNNQDNDAGSHTNEEKNAPEDELKRKETIKKMHTERSILLESPPRLPSPPFTRKEPTLSPVPSPPPEPNQEPPLPEIGLLAPPDLPEIVDKVEQARKKDKLRFVVEPPPSPQVVKEEPRKLRPAPRVRVIPKRMFRPRRSRPAEAPVSSEDLRDIRDPLDFLAKWCIINPDRLPFYELIFEYTVAEQPALYSKPAPTQEQTTGDQKDETDTKPDTKKHKTKKSSKEKESNSRNGLNTELLPTGRGMSLVKAAMTVEEQHLEKLIYTIDLLQEKLMYLGSSLKELEGRRLTMLARKARETFPLIASPGYTPRRKKGKNKKKNRSPDTDVKLKPSEITDDVIVSRLDQKMLKELCREEDMKLLESEIEIVRDKIAHIQGRVEEIAREKLLTDAFCMDHYFHRQGLAVQDEDFRRQQSELYNRLHPTPNFEMNLEEVEPALQQINNHLLTPQEFSFLYNILNLSGREKINFRLFTVIAALSEKVSQLDPVIRNLINKFDYNALDIKMEKCKELFELLELSDVPRGSAQAFSLGLELRAGGMRPEHTTYVLDKFTRDKKGCVDFLDFVTYIPLFVEIHNRIVQDPLKQQQDL